MVELKMQVAYIRSEKFFDEELLLQEFSSFLCIQTDNTQKQLVSLFFCVHRSMLIFFSNCKRIDNRRTRTVVKSESTILRQVWNKDEKTAAAATKKEHTHTMKETRRNNKIDDDDSALPITFTLFYSNSVKPKHSTCSHSPIECCLLCATRLIQNYF